MKQLIWFKRTGPIYLPVHPAGYFVIFMAIVFIVPIIMTMIRNGHSVSDDLYGLFIYGTCTAF